MVEGVNGARGKREVLVKGALSQRNCDEWSVLYSHEPDPDMELVATVCKYLPKVNILPIYYLLVSNEDRRSTQGFPQPRKYAMSRKGIVHLIVALATSLC